MGRHLPPLAVALLGVALRLWWALSGGGVPLYDAAAYRALALSLANGDGYSIGGVPSAWWVPGWPALLAVASLPFATADAAFVGVGVALGALTIVLCAEAARPIAGERGALLAATLVAVDPALVLLPTTLLSENLAIPGVLALLVLLQRWGEARHPARAGLLLGVAVGLLALVREASLALLLAPAALWLIRRPPRLPARSAVGYAEPGRPPRIGMHVAGLLLGVGLVLAPWVARNGVTLGLWGLSTSGPVNLAISWGPRAIVGHHPSPPEIAADTEAETAALAVGYARRGDVRAVLPLVPARVATDFTDTSWVGANQSRGIGDWLDRAAAGFRWWLLALAALGLLTRPWRTADGLCILLVLGCGLLPLLVTFGHGRFSAPLLGPLAILAARACTARSRHSARSVERGHASPSPAAPARAPAR